MNQGLRGWPMPAPMAVPYINVQDQKASGTAGGTFTSGSFQTRTLNTLQSDSAGIASLASNQLTLPAGTYRCNIQCPSMLTNTHKARLQNITDAVTVLLGTSEQTQSSANVSTKSRIAGRFTLTKTTVLEVQHQALTTGTTSGFGPAASFGTEVYTIAEFWKEG